MHSEMSKAITIKPKPKTTSKSGCSRKITITNSVLERKKITRERRAGGGAGGLGQIEQKELNQIINKSQEQKKKKKHKNHEKTKILTNFDILFESKFTTNIK